MKETPKVQPKTPNADMSRFPPTTHCLAAARTLGVPVIECPRRPSHRVPFCWLDAEGGEHWLAYSCGATEGTLQENRHQAMIRVMLRGVEHGRVMVVLYGRNEPVIYEGRLLDSGYPEFAVYHELFTEQGSVARYAAEYAKFWSDRDSYYRDFMVPGPDKLPDDQLEPLVARNRCHLLPPSEPRESLWTKYGGKGALEPQYDDEGQPLPPKPKAKRIPRAALPRKEKKKPRTDTKLAPAPRPKKAPAPPKTKRPAQGSALAALEDLNDLFGETR